MELQVKQLELQNYKIKLEVYKLKLELNLPHLMPITFEGTNRYFSL